MIDGSLANWCFQRLLLITATLAPPGRPSAVRETTAKCERNSQDSEAVCRNPHPGDVLSLTSRGQVETGPEDVEGSHGLEDPAMLLPKNKLASLNGLILSGFEAAHNFDQAIRLGRGQGLEKNPSPNAGDGSVSADAEPKAA